MVKRLKCFLWSVGGANVSNFLNLLPVTMVMSCPFRVMLMREYNGKTHLNLILVCPMCGREMFAFYLVCGREVFTFYFLCVCIFNSIVYMKASTLIFNCVVKLVRS